MRFATVIGAGVAGVALVSVGGFLANSDSVGEGQLVFTRWEPRTDDVEDPALGRVDIYACEVVDDGLRIRGHAPTESGGVTSVLVIPGEPTGSGLAVAASFAAMTGRVDNGVPGDFAVDLPWVSGAVTLAIADADSLGDSTRPVRRGEGAQCGSSQSGV